MLTPDYRWQHRSFRRKRPIRSSSIQPSPSHSQALPRHVWAWVHWAAPRCTEIALQGQDICLKKGSKPQKECLFLLCFCDYLLFQTPSTIKTSSLMFHLLIKPRCVRFPLKVVAKEEQCEIFGLLLMSVIVHLSVYVTAVSVPCLHNWAKSVI